MKHKKFHPTIFQWVSFSIIILLNTCGRRCNASVTNESSLIKTENNNTVYNISLPSSAPSLIPSFAPFSKPSILPSIIPSTRPSIIPSISPSLTPSEIPSISPSLTPTGTPSISPSLTPSIIPSTIPTIFPSISPSLTPSATPSIEPSSTPSYDPSITPSVTPSIIPSLLASVNPSRKHSTVPSMSKIPSYDPSMLPSSDPTKSPSMNPSISPTDSPSLPPSRPPSIFPSGAPSKSPSESHAPSITNMPSKNPSSGPSNIPSSFPSTQPSLSSEPSGKPSLTPSVIPTLSFSPSGSPSDYPSLQPTRQNQNVFLESLQMTLYGISSLSSSEQQDVWRDVTSQTVTEHWKQNENILIVSNSPDPKNSDEFVETFETSILKQTPYVKCPTSLIQARGIMFAKMADDNCVTILYEQKFTFRYLHDNAINIVSRLDIVQDPFKTASLRQKYVLSLQDASTELLSISRSSTVNDTSSYPSQSPSISFTNKPSVRVSSSPTISFKQPPIPSKQTPVPTAISNEEDTSLWYVAIAFLIVFGSCMLFGGISFFRKTHREEDDDVCTRCLHSVNILPKSKSMKHRPRKHQSMDPPSTIYRTHSLQATQRPKISRNTTV